MKRFNDISPGNIIFRKDINSGEIVILKVIEYRFSEYNGEIFIHAKDYARRLYLIEVPRSRIDKVSYSFRGSIYISDSKEFINYEYEKLFESRNADFDELYSKYMELKDFEKRTEIYEEVFNRP